MSRFTARMLLPLALAGFAAGAVAGEPAARPASIPFANHGGISDWKADGTRGLWVQDVHRQWYYAELMGPCTGLDFVEKLGFETGPDGALDQHGAVSFKDAGMLVQRCVFRTFVRSDGPPKAKKKQPEQKVPTAYK